MENQKTEIAKEAPVPAFVNGFESNTDKQLATRESGALSSVAREEAELKGAIFLARQFPRNEFDSANRIVGSCKRLSFAKGARYKFPRGNSDIVGPSVDLARESARCWGNIRYGFRVVSVDDHWVHLKGYAHDLETNNYAELEDKFKKLVQRKQGGKTNWVEPDERDLRELCNRRGAILERNCILKVIPPDVVEDAMAQVAATLTAAANGELKKSKDEVVKDLVRSFEGIAVTAAMLETHLGHSLQTISAEELVELRTIGKSIVDGNSRREEYFDFGKPEPESPAPDSAQAKLAAKKEELKKQADEARAKVDAAKKPAADELMTYKIQGENSPYFGWTIEALKASGQLNNKISLDDLTDEDKSRIVSAMNT